MSFWGRRRSGKDVPNFNVASEVERLARNESRSAFAFVDEAGIIERHGYGDISRRATRWASLLTENGVLPGDRVLVLAGRRIEWPSALLGVMKAGAVAVPCPASLDAAELDARAADCEAVLVVSAGATPSALMLPTLDADEERARLDAQPLATPTYHADGRDPALILYSRGRGVVHTHASCRAQALPAEQWLDLREGDRVWCTAEPGTTDSILSLLGAWMLGAEWLLHEDTPDADGRLELIDQAGVTVLWQTAAEYEGMSAVERPHWYDLSRVRAAVTTGEPLSVEEGDRFLVTFAIPVLAGWGQAETGIVIGERRGSASRPGTIGLALGEVDVAVVDERGQELPIGVEGELAVRGRPPGLFDGYWNAQRDTAAAFRNDVYLTGIGASRDDAGHVRLVERQPPAVVSLPERRRRDAARLAEEQRAREADEQRGVEETRLAEVSAAEERLARDQEQERQAAERAEQQRLKADERARRSQEQQQQREARHAEKAERERLKVERRVEQERIRREQDEARRAAKLAGREAASAEKQAQAEQRSRDEEAARAAKEQAAAEQRRREEEEARLAQQQAAAQAREQEQARQAALERERAAAEQRRREEEEARLAQQQAAAQAREQEQARQAALERERAAAEQRRREEEEARLAQQQAAAQAREQEQARQAALERERAAAEQRRREEEEARLAQQQAAAQAREQEQARQAALERERAAAEQRRREEEEARLAQQQAAAQAREQEQARQAALERERAAAEAEARERADRAAAERRRLDEERERAAAAAVAAEARRREARAQAEAAEERERQAAAERKRAEEERRRHEERERAATEAKLREQARAEAEARERADRAAAEQRRLDEERRRREAEPATKGRRRTETRLRRSKTPATPPTPEFAESEEPDTVHHGLLDRMRAYGISVTPPEGADSEAAGEPDEKRKRAG